VIASARARALLILGGVALVGIAIALALSQRSSPHHGAGAAGAGPWYTALAAPYTAATTHRRTACGLVLGPRTMGVAHPVLPCGVKIYVRFGAKDVLTQVIDRGHTGPGHDFDLTIPLARVLGVQGVQTIQWRFAK
jgi:rare lipoprotein A (peptidoglycan hydrolase)